jgi:hypothetical protein
MPDEITQAEPAPTELEIKKQFHSKLIFWAHEEGSAMLVDKARIAAAKSDALIEAASLMSENQDSVLSMLYAQAVTYARESNACYEKATQLLKLEYSESSCDQKSLLMAKELFGVTKIGEGMPTS